MRKIWATTEAWPHSDDVKAAAANAGATEIITLPCSALPYLAIGYNEISPPAPSSVTPLQMRRALRQLNMRDAVEAAVAGADPDTKDAWEFATIIVRSDPIIAAMAAALGKTEQEVDDLFRLASTFE